MTKPLNALIAEALGWRTWEDMRQGREGDWYQERDGAPGRIEAMPLIDYIAILRDDSHSRRIGIDPDVSRA